MKRKQQVSIDIIRELENNYRELSEVSNSIKQKIQKLLEAENSRSFRQLVMEKEITQLLSGFASLERLKIDMLKQLREIAKEGEEDKQNDIKTVLSALLKKNETSD